MAKNKKFDWESDSEDFNTEIKFKKRDNKRYDKKKSNIQKARRNKAKSKNAFFEGN